MISINPKPYSIISSLFFRKNPSNMESEIFPTTTGKKRRTMIITGDESIIEQIQNSEISSLIRSCIIELHDDEEEPSHTTVKRNSIKKYTMFLSMSI